MGNPAWPYLVLALLAYTLGAIPTGVIAGRWFRGVDVRQVGSGHTGMMNTYRAAGLIPAVVTLAGDGGKGLVAVLVARLWLGDSWAVSLAAALVVIGHCYPVTTRFRGGMGLATAGGVFFLLQPFVLAALIAAWFPLRRILGDSTGASICVAVLLPLLLWAVGATVFTVAAGIAVGAILATRHLQVVLQRRRALA